MTIKSALLSARQYLKRAKPARQSRKWGAWTFRPPTFELAIKRNQRQYEVDLDECKTAADVLDWIMQVRGKTGIDDKDLADLIHALDDILSIQANLCPGGENRTVDPRTLAKQRGFSTEPPQGFGETN